MKQLKYVLLFLTLLTGFSCKKADYFTYKDIARIQFGPELSLLYSFSSAFKDSTKTQTFAYLSNTTLIDTVWFDIYTMGNISKQDRPFSIVQEPVSGAYNAAPGVHYKNFTDQDIAKNYIVKAGDMHSRVPIILIRDATLKSNNAVLKIVIAENEHFKWGQENLLWRRLTFTDKLSKPASWNVGMLGKYSEVKHRFMISVTGEKWDDAFIAALPADVQAQQYYVGKVKSALIAYNAEHPGNPLKDEDGDLVIIP